MRASTPYSTSVAVIAGCTSTSCARHSSMLALDFVKANRETVERAIRDKGVGLDLDALLALDGDVRGFKTEIERLRAERNAISAHSKDSPDEKAELGPQGKGSRRARGGSRGRAGGEGSGAEGADAEASRNSLRRRAGRARRELQHRHPHGRRAAQVRFRAARPCRADREERLGRPVAGDAGIGQPDLLPQGSAGAA